MRFQPSATGLQTDTLTIDDDADNAPQKIPLPEPASSDGSRIIYDNVTGEPQSVKLTGTGQNQIGRDPQGPCTLSKPKLGFGRRTAVRKSVFLCRSRANPNGCEGCPICETLAFSDPSRREPMPSEAPDHLSNLVPRTFISRGYGPS